MSTSIRGPRYREHLLAEGMHKILIRKAGQANGSTGSPFSMKVVKFKEHVPKGFHLAATMEAVEGCGPPCAIMNPRAGIEIRAQWMGAARQKESATLSVGVKRALHCHAKLTFDDRVTVVFDSTAKATADDLLATLETLAVLREELPVALDNAGGELRKLSGPRNDLERCSNSRGEGSTEDGRDVEVRAYTDSTQRDVVGEDDNQQPMISRLENTKGSKRCDTGWYSDARVFPLHDSTPEDTLGSAASRSTAMDEIDEPMTDLDRGNTSVAEFGGRESYASASPLSDSQAPSHGDVRGTSRCDNQTQGDIDRPSKRPHKVQRQEHENRSGTGTSHALLPLHPSAPTGSRQTSGDMRSTLVDALGDGSKVRKVDRPLSSADEALLHGAPSMPADFGLMLTKSQGSPTSGLKAAQSRVTSARASSGSDGVKERRTAPQHPEPETRRLGPKDVMEKMQAALQHVDSDSETVFQVNDVFDDVNVKSAPPDRRKVETKLRGGSWECRRCTFINDEIHFRCGMCRAVRPREEYHLRSIRTPVPRFSEYKINQRMRVEDARRSKCTGSLADAQSGESQDGDGIGDDAASSQNKQTRREKMKAKRAEGGCCTKGAGVGRPRRGQNGVSSGHSNGAASETRVGSSRRSPPQSTKVEPGRRWTVQVSDSPSSDGRIGPSAGSILRMFVEWAATPGPSPFTLDTSILAEEASQGLNDTKTPSHIKKRRGGNSGGNDCGARVDACSSSTTSPLGERVCDSSRKRKPLLEDDVSFTQRAAESDVELSDKDIPFGESNGAPAGASEAESEGIEYFVGDGYETEEDVDLPSKSMELDGSA